MASLRLTSCTFSAVLLCLLPMLGQAASTIANGGFETGSLEEWSSGGQQGGGAQVISEGTCFSAFDTTGMTLNGHHAALLRAGPKAPAGSTAVLTSAPFTAGIGVSFSALTQFLNKRGIDKMPVTLIVRILTAEGAALAALGFNTHTVELNFGCPGEPVDGAFYTHFIDTRKFIGQSIRIEFMQRVKKPGFPLFTLIDDVTRFEEGESQVFPDRPNAVAGLSQNAGGRLRLDGSLSSDPIGGSLEFTWRVHEETFDREGEFPCIDDLPPGRHKATLIVSNGLHADADDLYFTIARVIDNTPPEPEGPPNQDDEDDEETGSDDVRDGALSLDCSDSTTDDGDSGDGDTDAEDSESDGNIRSNAASLSTTAIVWKPISESDGNLVILTPTSMGSPGASLFNSSGTLVETGRYVGHTNGNRATYRFDRPGASYTSPAYLKVGGQTYEVSSTSQRYN